MERISELKQRIARVLPAFEIAEEELLAKHTSFRIGGPAEVMVFPRTREELAAVLRAAAELEVKPRLLGAGTNVLAPDEGVRGLVIVTRETLMGLELVTPTRIAAMAGMTLAQTANFAARNRLSGLEFAHGIPGTVGGGVYMNAGAYGGEICQICENVEVMDLDGNLSRLSNAEMAFSYRHSALENRPGIVVSADFALKKGNSEEIWTKMKDLIACRTASQPLDVPSAGSAFKRPTGGYAAALIEEAGLKGYQVGGAAISAKHAGFAVNLGGATAADVKALLSQVSEQVYQKSGIRLEPEVRIW